MKTNITGIKVFSSTEPLTLEEQINNYLKREECKISIIKRDISTFGNKLPVLCISLCTTNKGEFIGPLEKVKIFSNISTEDSILKAEKDANDFISTKGNIIDVLFHVCVHNFEVFRSIAVFYLD